MSCKLWLDLFCVLYGILVLGFGKNQDLEFWDFGKIRKIKINQNKSGKSEKSGNQNK